MTGRTTAASSNAGRTLPAISSTGHKQNQADRQMHHQGMKPSQELLPIRMRLSVQPEEKGRSSKEQYDQQQMRPRRPFTL